MNPALSLFSRGLLLFTLILGISNLAMAEGKHYSSATDLQLSAQNLGSVSVGRDMQLHAVQVEGKLAAGRDVTCTQCEIQGGIAAGHNVLLEGCPQVGSISSGHNTEITGSQIANNIASGNDILLNGSTAAQRVSAGNQVLSENSTIKGLLKAGGHYIRLDHSQAADVLFSNSNQLSMGGIQVSGNSHSVVSVGASSLSSINGYTVKGAMNQTTLITPEQAIYVNGVKVSGEGSRFYADYRAAHVEAPVVEGPGWARELSMVAPASSKPKAQKLDKTPKTVVNVLELTNNSVVSGLVQFESGYGKIVVHKGSQFNGRVQNGIIEKQ